MAKMTRTEAEQTIENLILMIGEGFHVDTPMYEYVDKRNRAIFCVTSALEYQAKLDSAIDALDELGIDAYEVALTIIREAFDVATDETRSYGPRI